MTQGRKVEAERLVSRLHGCRQAKARLLLFLESLSGRRTIAVAALDLGVSERRFYQLRDQLLQAALDSLAPRAMGRPSRDPNPDDRVAALEAQVRDLRLDLRAAQVREEIALTMPHLLRATGRKKGAKRRPRKRSPPAGSAGFNACDPLGSQRRADTDAVSPLNATCASWNAASGSMPSRSVAGPCSSV